MDSEVFDIWGPLKTKVLLSLQCVHECQSFLSFLIGQFIISYQNSNSIVHLKLEKIGQFSFPFAITLLLSIIFQYYVLHRMQYNTM